MTAFWAWAIVFALVALGFLLVPIWRHRSQAGRWPIAGLVAMTVMAPAAVALYLHVSNWNPSLASSALPPIEQMVATLARRLEQNPNDAGGWQMLGRSYIALGRYPDALRAYREAWARTRAPDNELKLGLAEAEVLNDRSLLTGEAGRLVEDVLNSEPGNMKALWYGGLVALETDRPDVARERWVKLVSLNPPQGVVDLIQQQLGALGVPHLPAASSGAVAATPSAGAATPQTGSPAAGPSISLKVRLGDGVSTAALGPQAALFLFARAPGGGPPVAVRREAATTLPGTFSLTDANAMIPGRSLGDFDVLTLVARVSASGQPMGAAGDLYGQIEYRPGSDPSQVDLVIDQVQQ